MDRLKNKVAIITGGAAGIGEVTARLFADEGASVVIAARNEKNGARVVADIEKDHPGKAIFCRMDVSREEDWEKCIAAAKDAFGSIKPAL